MQHLTMTSSKQFVIVLMGPTASGKTELAIKIAQYFNLNIHNIDSRQIYKEMNIGTATPSLEQQESVKHFLINFKKPNQKINVKEFQKIALTSINSEIRKGKYPFLVGGSGLYINAITNGFISTQVPPQEFLREQLLKLGQAQCWELLKSCDPLSTKRIYQTDNIRTIRALEVFYATGKSITKQQGTNPPPWEIIELGLDRDNLNDRIIQRTTQMFKDGILIETQKIMEKYGENLPLLKTIGYAEAKEVLRENLNINEAIIVASKKTMNFAKRQRTWFRNKNNPLWLDNKNPLKDAIIKIKSAICKLY